MRRPSVRDPPQTAGRLTHHQLRPRVSYGRRIPLGAQGLLLGAAAGALFGVSDIAIKYLADAVQDGALELISPWSGAALAASLVAFYASARGLQIGPGVEVIALTSVAANLTAIVGGILVFRDPIGTGALEISGRMLAFCLVVAGAALIPPRSEPPAHRPMPLGGQGRWLPASNP